MTNLAAPSLLTYYSETTAGVPPANAAAWISDGVRLRHIGDSLDVSGVERVQLEDMRNQLRVKGNERRVEGLDNPEFPFSVYGHGIGEVTAAGDQVADSAPGYELASLLGHAIGSVSRGYSNTITGGTSTTTVLAVTDASNHVVGDFVAVQFATPPTGYAATTAWPRRIIARDIVSTPNTITLDQVLPATPAAADLVHGCIAIYHDEDVLADSSAASGRTRSWLVQKGLPGAGASVRESWIFRGCVAQLQQFTFERGGLMQFAFNVMAASHEDPTTADWPTAWSSNAELGLAPLSISPITEVWMVTDGVTTNTRVSVSRFEVEPGIPRVRTETLTSNSVGMMGTAGYATQPADTVLTMTLDPFGIAQWTDQLAGTEKTIRWARLGPAGSGFAVHFPRMSHMVTPKRAINNATTSNEVQLLAHEEENLGTSNLQRSTMVLVMW